MRVKDLIKELSKLDPEAVVNTSKGPIHFVDQLPGYYDGCYEELIIDPKLSPYYDIVGMKFSKDKTKVILRDVDISDLIYNCDSKEEMNALKWEFDKSIHPETIARIKKKVEEMIEIVILDREKNE